MTKIQKLLTFSLFSVLFFLFASPAFGAILYLSPYSQNSFPGESFVVEVKINTEGEDINVVDGHLRFPREKLKVLSIEKGGSILNLWPKEPSYSNQNGEINFTGGTTTGFEGRGKLLSIIFQFNSGIIPPDFASVKFEKDSKVLLADGRGTLAKISFSGGNYKIVKKSENLPSVSSKSHPDQNRWFPYRDLLLHWQLVKGAQYSYLLSRNPLDRPDEIPDRPKGKLMWLGDMIYKGLSDGVYYFTLRQKLPGEDWSESTVYRVMIDSTPPEKFKIEIGQEPSIFNGKPFLSFSTTDKGSGVDYYEIKEGKKDWKEVSSPCLLKNQYFGQKITIRACDKAGNCQESEIKIPIKTTWEDWLITIIILIIIVASWVFLKRKNFRKFRISKF